MKETALATKGLNNFEGSWDYWAWSQHQHVLNREINLYMTVARRRYPEFFQYEDSGLPLA